MTNTNRGGFGRPSLLTPDPDGIPTTLKGRDQWVLFRTRHKPNGKLDKIPVNPTPTRCNNERCCKPGSNDAKFHDASVSDPTTWGSFEAVLRRYQSGGFAGIGFVVTEADEIVGGDLDGCRNPDTGAVEPWAQAIVDELDTYTEPSVSGTGLRLFAFGTLPPTGRKKGHIELYSSGRFFTITGRPIGTAEIRACNGTLTALHHRIFGDTKPKETTPRVGPALSLEDAEVLERARNGANGRRFSALYDRGDWQGQGYESQSAADLALCNDLRFWTGADPHQMDRQFRRSGLMRPKWDEQRGELTYGQRTITLALTGPVYTPAATVTIKTPPADAAAPTEHDPRQAEIDRLRDELEELRAVNRGILAIVRSEAKPAAKIAAIELAIEAHTSRPEDFTSLGGVAGRINQSDDSVSETCKAYRVEAADDPAPFRVAYEARMVNPWTGEVSGEPHIYTKITPTHARLSDTLAAIAAAIPDALKKKPRADRGTKAPPAQIPDELIPPCPDDLDAETVQHPEIVQVARCDDCGAPLAAMTHDGAILTATTDISGSGNPDPHQHGRGLSSLYTDKSGRGAEASRSRAAWVQACIERDRVRRQISTAQLQDGDA